MLLCHLQESPRGEGLELLANLMRLEPLPPWCASNDESSVQMRRVPYLSLYPSLSLSLSLSFSRSLFLSLSLSLSLRLAVTCTDH